ncbi:TVP38/TMEM64 family protein [Wenzhouxiangella limi]|uniref:TVP38/TMEM64 family membrane protein n=1 Tax=Wenzhouxiangella limi TaxID=2707351 RepID=A0A845UVT4_9GAMM|nr:VTT domain-containing protein [Wenzhouxiangella limi]NDY94342.1 TVP38/TMEM64 family protein [Wenzhouxiangella limi]
MSRPGPILLLVVLTLLALALGWQWLATQGVLSAELLQQWISVPRAYRDSPWMVFLVTGVFCLSLLVMFPLTILVVLCGLLFGPAWGFVYAAVGTLSSSVVTYWIGRRLGHTALMSFGGQRARDAASFLNGKALPAMTLINLLPLAPFTLTNLMAGALRLRFRDYLAGSALGILPGLAAVTLIGSELASLMRATDRRDAILSLGILLVLILFLVLLRRRSYRPRA